MDQRENFSPLVCSLAVKPRCAQATASVDTQSTVVAVAATAAKEVATGRAFEAAKAFGHSGEWCFLLWHQTKGTLKGNSQEKKKRGNFQCQEL